MGGSGSGESTLGRVALGFLAPDAGRVGTCGVAPHRARGRAPRALRRAVGVVHQDGAGAPNPRLTLGRTAAEGLRIHGHPPAGIEAEVRRLLDRVGPAGEITGRFPHGVSGGQRRRVRIARAPALGPRLPIADEPVTARGVSARARIPELLAELRAELGLAMLLASHDLEVVGALCDRVSVLHRGRVVERGPAEAALRRPSAGPTRALVESPPAGRRPRSGRGRADPRVAPGGLGPAASVP